MNCHEISCHKINYEKQLFVGVFQYILSQNICYIPNKIPIKKLPFRKGLSRRCFPKKLATFSRTTKTIDMNTKSLVILNRKVGNS